MRISVWLTVFVVLIVGIQGCMSGSVSQDEAMIVKAQRSLERVKSALELYRFDHGTYPANGTALGDAIRPYVADWDSLVEESFRYPPRYETPDSATTYFVVATAQDRNETKLALRPAIDIKKQEEPEKGKNRRR